MFLRHRAYLMFGVIAFAALAGEATAGNGYTFTQIDGPGSASTDMFGINDLGVVVGMFQDGTGVHGLEYDNGSYSQFDYPGASQTQFTAVANSGTVVAETYSGGGYEAYLLQGGFGGNSVGPLTEFSASRTDVPGISSDASNLAGSFFPSPCCGTAIGFADIHGISSVINAGASTDVVPRGVNDSGAVAGYYLLNGLEDSFVWNNGVMSPINPNVPGYDSLAPQANGINNFGSVVGFLPYAGEGFLYSNGVSSLVTVPVPHNYVIPYGINDIGQIVGQYSDSSGYHGFLLTPTGVGTPVQLRNYSGGTMAAPRPLPVQAIGSIVSPISGYGSQDFYSFQWTAGYTNSINVIGSIASPASNGSYLYEMFQCTPNCAHGTLIFQRTLSGGDGFTSNVDFIHLTNGLYEIGFVANSPYDPMIGLDFVTPVQGPAASVPEPAAWATILIGFGGVGYAVRRRRVAPARIL